MKRFASLAILVILILPSCDKDSRTVHRPTYPFIQRMSESYYISDSLHVAPFYITSNNSYEDLGLHIYVRVSDMNYDFPDSVSREIYTKIRDKARPFLDSPYSKNQFSYCNAGLRSGTRIYVDKVLFGREPGANLADMFKVHHIYDPNITRYETILSYPDWNILYPYDAQNKPETFEEFAAEGTLLCGYNTSFATLLFKEIPEEIYDEFTLSVEIPITSEYLYDFPESYYEEYDLPRSGDRLLKSSVKLTFTANPHLSL